jgi:hypothetical protein
MYLIVTDRKGKMYVDRAVCPLVAHDKFEREWRNTWNCLGEVFMYVDTIEGRSLLRHKRWELLPNGSKCGITIKEYA